jgi:hypothetical protein
MRSPSARCLTPGRVHTLNPTPAAAMVPRAQRGSLQIGTTTLSNAVPGQHPQRPDGTTLRSNGPLWKISKN